MKAELFALRQIKVKNVMCLCRMAVLISEIEKTEKILTAA